MNSQDFVGYSNDGKTFFTEAGSCVYKLTENMILVAGDVAGTSLVYFKA